MKLNKKKLFVLSVAVCLVAILSVSTLAWFNTSSSIKNEFFFADNNTPSPNFSIQLFETNEEEEEDYDGQQFVDIFPGDEIKKDPTVRNTGKYSMYVRMIVTLTNASAWLEISDKYALCDEVDVAENESKNLYVFEEVLTTIDSDWIRYDVPVYDEGNDTLTYVYYYNEILEQTEVTSLFQLITIPTDITEDDRNLFAVENEGNKFEINIKADAIQQKNIFGSNNSEKPEGEQNDAYKAFIGVASWMPGTAYSEPTPPIVE